MTISYRLLLILVMVNLAASQEVFNSKSSLNLNLPSQVTLKDNFYSDRIFPHATVGQR